MNLLDRLPLGGRRYERRRSAASKSRRLELNEVLRMYDHKAILELALRRPGEPPRQFKPDSERKLHLALLDMLSELKPEEGSRYEVFETAPSGDLSRVRIRVRSEGGEQGELSMLMGGRSLDDYFDNDPALDSILSRTLADGSTSEPSATRPSS